MKRYNQYIILLLLVLFLTGCKAEKEKEGEAKIEKKDKAPSSISDFSQGLQEILNYVEEIEKILDDSDIKMNEEKIKEAKKNREDEKSPKKEEEKDEDKEKDEEMQEEKEKSNKILEIWTDMDKKIEDIHNKWNLYGVEGIKKGISINEKDKLEERLNSLTKAIEERNITNIYEYGSQTMLELEFVFQLYKDEIKGSTNKIKYYTYQSYLKAMEGRNTQAQNLLDDLSQDLNQIRTKLEKDEEKIKVIDRLKLSIDSMKVGLKEKSPKLYRIKKDIIIKNINELEK